MSLMLLLLILLLIRLNILVILYTRYTQSHAGVRQNVCRTKYNTKQSATPHAWWGPLLNPWGPPLESHIAGCWHDGGILSALAIQTQYMYI